MPIMLLWAWAWACVLVCAVYRGTCQTHYPCTYLGIYGCTSPRPTVGYPQGSSSDAEMRIHFVHNGDSSCA
ncbi:predicted protein [Plenodomus lingam JN3]|uniref:Predicted protein n=1 Tax=Leptosphaeria maculans (strain JN3 / isolate v23.1.3 / race Av1-4-5-6-7-8) TaxID=985895 RepID=E4ZMG5_LEPMJ|nr:predicted protein [Plenodomus lingam JN3]CBX92834.1 predicted protein [Plenodomus lingam JN3]